MVKTCASVSVKPGEKQLTNGMNTQIAATITAAFGHPLTTRIFKVRRYTRKMQQNEGWNINRKPK